MDLFRVPQLSAAADRKLAIIRDTYGALYEEAQAAAPNCGSWQSRF